MSFMLSVVFAQQLQMVLGPICTSSGTGCLQLFVINASIYLMGRAGCQYDLEFSCQENQETSFVDDPMMYLVWYIRAGNTKGGKYY